MADTGDATRRQKPKGKDKLSLSEIAHKQRMEYLEAAEKSQYPEIRAAALKWGDRLSKQESARVSPTLVLWVNLGAAVVAAVASCYFFLNYKQALAYELSVTVILLFLAIVAVSLFVSGHLSQPGFMKILGWLPEHFRAWRTSRQTASGETRSEDDQP